MISTLLQWFVGEFAVCFIVGRLFDKMITYVPDADKYVAVSWSMVILAAVTIIWSVVFFAILEECGKRNWK